MNTDRELLELAAKAAGIEVNDDMRELWQFKGSSAWNPLTDDGDALRLAVKLGLMIDYATKTEVGVGNGFGDFYEKSGTDPYAATRRAIVRAAAEIGRSM